jgi:hypothetical protein
MPDVIPAAIAPETGNKSSIVTTIVIAAVAAYLLRELLKGDSSRNTSRNPSSGVSLSDIEQWINNDEGLYDWWRSSRSEKTGKRMSKREFIRENRAELKSAIQKVISGDKPAHWLKYGPIRYEGTNPRRRSKKRKK